MGLYYDFTGVLTNCLFSSLFHVHNSNLFFGSSRIFYLGGHYLLFGHILVTYFSLDEGHLMKVIFEELFQCLPSFHIPHFLDIARPSHRPGHFHIQSLPTEQSHQPFHLSISTTVHWQQQKPFSDVSHTSRGTTSWVVTGDETRLLSNSSNGLARLRSRKRKGG